MFEQLLTRLRMDLAAFANALSELLASPSARVQPVTIVLPAGETSASIEHGLEQAYRGAVIVGVTPPHSVQVAIPDGTVESTRTVTVATTSAPASDITVNLWVS